jgi:hydroxymethylpyrimidine/phosphomethylpyrimidine kinase
MSNERKVPTALTVAGSDSGGGAGVQADLKTFAALGVHGTSAITCLTAQNPKGVLGVQECRPDMVALQMEAVMKELPPKAIKTGMLYSAAIIRKVAGVLRDYPRIPVVVDPVMVSTSGAALLKDSARAVLEKELFPLATLITPNLDEAGILTGTTIREPEELRECARALHSRYGCAILVKGGHLKGMREAVDLFFDGQNELLVSSPFVRGVSTHGTGCTYSAAIAACLAHGQDLAKSVELAKEYISEAITQWLKAGRHTVLNHWWQD